ncbi:hypothetical protein QQ045_009164 [Rhodiola kirilowii]
MLSRYNLAIESIRGQGYDGASNTRGEWNGLQALVARECSYAYYVHCLASRLQLSLVAASKEVYHVQHFLEKLNFIINIVSASCKRNDQLRDAHVSNVAFLLTTGELESGKDGNTHSQRGKASSVYETMTSLFYFVFIMHLIREVLDITSCLCNALQFQSQDILNAMSLVSTSKSLLQKLRDDVWSKLVEKIGASSDQQMEIITEEDEKFDALIKFGDVHGDMKKVPEELRKELGLYASLVNCFNLPGLPTRHENVGENSEGEYDGLDHEVVPGVVESLKVITKFCSERIAKYAFEYAYLNNRKMVTSVHKANIMKLVDVLFLESCREITTKYPGIKYNEMIVDNTCIQLISRPEQFDVMLWRWEQSATSSLSYDDDDQYE